MAALIWDGKYDEHGRRVAPPRVALPFQTVETVNESAQERRHMLDLFSSGRDTEWRNRLIWGDKKYVLPSLLPEFAGKVDLIYIDPPFATGQDFSLPIDVDGREFTKERSMIDVKAYRDTCAHDIDSYVEWFHEMATHFYSLLSETGSLYVHVDPGMSQYARMALNELFGPARFLNEVVWRRTHAHSGAPRFGGVHEVILVYTRSERYIWNTQWTSYTKDYLDKFFRCVDTNVKRYRATILTGSGTRTGASGRPWRGPAHRHGLGRAPTAVEG